MAKFAITRINNIYTSNTCTPRTGVVPQVTERTAPRPWRTVHRPRPWDWRQTLWSYAASSRGGKITDDVTSVTLNLPRITATITKVTSNWQRITTTITKIKRSFVI